MCACWVAAAARTVVGTGMMPINDAEEDADGGAAGTFLTMGIPLAVVAAALLTAAIREGEKGGPIGKDPAAAEVAGGPPSESSLDACGPPRPIAESDGTGGADAGRAGGGVMARPTAAAVTPAVEAGTSAPAAGPPACPPVVPGGPGSVLDGGTAGWVPPPPASPPAWCSRRGVTAMGTPNPPPMVRRGVGSGDALGSTTCHAGDAAPAAAR